MSQLDRSKEKIEKLNREVEMIGRFVAPLENIEGLEVSWVEGVKGDNGFLSCKVDGLDMMHKILEVYPTTERDAQLTFAGRDAVETYSPFTIEFNNWSPEYPLKKASVKWFSDEIDIWVDVPVIEFEEHMVRHDQHEQARRHGRIVTKVNGFHTFIQTSGISVMKYASGSDWGNSYKTYAINSTERPVMDKILKVNQ